MNNRVPTSLIEKTAIGKLKEALLATGRIDPHIPENDTQIFVGWGI